MNSACDEPAGRELRVERLSRVEAGINKGQKSLTCVSVIFAVN